MRYLYYIVILSISINSYSNELSNEQYVLNKKVIDSLDQQESGYPNFLTKESVSYTHLTLPTTPYV